MSEVPEDVALNPLRATRLRDGTIGYFMRREDDCFRAALATVLEVPMLEVPDWDIDVRLAAGESPDEIRASGRQALFEWLEQRNLRIVWHPTPEHRRGEPVAVSLPRWIGVAGGVGEFGDHCYVMAGGELLHDPADIARFAHHCTPGLSHLPALPPLDPTDVPALVGGFTFPTKEAPDGQDEQH